MTLHPSPAVPDFFRPDLEDDTLFHVGVSAGKDSTAVLLWMINESGVPRELINATFSDTGNEHEWTYEHIDLISRTVHPITTLTPELGFYDLAAKKQRFPSSQRRFCTEHLKIKTTQAHIDQLVKKHPRVVAVSGVRADESEKRRGALEWDYSGRLLTLQWRPIIRWTLADVIAYHEKHGVPLNRLYAAGARRVGCWPCIMSSKAEIRNIALNFPERIDHIREEEKRVGSTFFSPNTVPLRFRSREVWGKRKEEMVAIATIDDVVRWSLTGKGAKGSHADDPPAKEAHCMSGFCE